MADERKLTIIEEIRYWRKNRLLPAEYCDFLLALYTEGENHKDEAVRSSTHDRFNLSYLYLAITLILLPLSFLVINFTEIDIILQTGLLSTFVIAALYHYRWLKVRDSHADHIPLIVGLLIVLLLSVSIIQYVWTTNSSIIMVVAANCLLWFWLGWILKVNYMIVSSVLGIVLLLLYIV